MNHHDDGQQHEHEGDGTTVSEGGSGALNADTALGGADAVPDTPDINDTGEGDGVDTSEQGQGDGSR
ncbi:hypothetical protein [Ornithinimicrobium cerasi]|uniref:Uncharacterized protein n=1 Tax=Ornithinimicrobium cerasi TaxID=2248773 RepID=A0A285VBL7_9MICO|nr:hypothetical protein [Ornithinimicrobium cerasi]SOC51450.1 hypothetical protein SAMN05421879_101198 [Ornithinimicrobium cerasi]